MREVAYLILGKFLSKRRVAGKVTSFFTCRIVSPIMISSKMLSIRTNNMAIALLTCKEIKYVNNNPIRHNQVERNNVSAIRQRKSSLNKLRPARRVSFSINAVRLAIKPNNAGTSVIKLKSRRLNVDFFSVILHHPCSSSHLFPPHLICESNSLWQYPLTMLCQVTS